MHSNIYIFMGEKNSTKTKDSWVNY